MTAPMTPERLTEIRACDAEMTDILLVVRPAVRHRRELLAEVDRLSAQTVTLYLVPVSLATAQQFVSMWHRHQVEIPRTLWEAT